MPKPSTRTGLIDVGLDLVRSAGYTATGINQVLAAAGIPKGSFYHHFKTKDEFILEVIRRYAAGEADRMERLLHDPALSPLTRLRRYFQDLIATYGRQGGPIAGCLFGNLSLEVAGQNEVVRQILTAAFSGWQDALAEVLREAIARKELPPSANPDDLAALLVNGWEGAQVRAKATQTDKPLELFFNYAFHTLLKA